MIRDGHTYSGTRDEVLAALSQDAAYHTGFGTWSKAQEAETAITCVVGGSTRVSVGTFTYDVTADEPIA
jgi:hypothetical protein